VERGQGQKWRGLLVFVGVSRASRLAKDGGGQGNRLVLGQLKVLDKAHDRMENPRNGQSRRLGSRADRAQWEGFHRVGVVECGRLGRRLCRWGFGEGMIENLKNGGERCCLTGREPQAGMLVCVPVWIRKSRWGST